MNILIVDAISNDINITASALKIPWPDAEITRCASGRGGLKAVGKNRRFDLIVVDLDLPDMSGFEFLESLFLYSFQPTIVQKKGLSETDVVQAMQQGADECLNKPIHQLEFIAKSQAAVRRSTGRDDIRSMTMGRLRLEAEIHRAYVDGKEIALTRNENIIMSRLMQNCGRIISYGSVSRAVWGNYLPSANCALRVCIRRLRQKLSLENSHIQIVTERGTGFRLVTDK